MLSRAMIPILLITLLAATGVALADAPPWEVRAYLSTYTDDPARSATETWAWNYTAIRHQHLCTWCGYSTSAPSPAPGIVCPNPWSVAGHPANRPLVAASPRQRVLGYLGLEAENIDGLPADETARRPLVGRPFHPGGVDEPRSIAGGSDQVGWNVTPSPWEGGDYFAPEDVGSFMTLRAHGLDGVVSDGNGMRFLVIAPGSVRASARHDYIDSAGQITADATFYNTAGDAGTAGPEDYVIHINPYRVSDGDEYIIRHHERTELVGGVFSTELLGIDVYSILYGNEFGIDPAEGAEARTSFYANGGAVVITDSGALRVEVPRQFHEVEAEGTWVLKVRIRSNTMTLPRPREVDFDYELKYGDGGGVYNDPGEVEPDLITDIGADLSFFKEPYVVADTTRTPLLRTADAGGAGSYDVVEKAGEAFISREIWPYRMPAAAAGRGRAMVQWSESLLAPTWAAAPVNLPDPDNRPVFFRTGREWHYVVDPAYPAQRLVTNEHTATQTPFSGQIPGAATVNPTYIDTYFMSSRVEPLLTGDIWAREEPGAGLVDRGAAEADVEEATGGFPRVILGDENLLGYGGEYGPGTTSASRLFHVGNRKPAFVEVGEPPQTIPARILSCPVSDGGCGARYLNDLLSAGDACPACDVPLEAVRGHAEVLYDSVAPLTALLGGWQVHRMPFDSLRFLPGGSMIPMGASSYPQRLRAEIPRYQPPSVPGASIVNDIANDFGYRGTAVAFHRDGMNDQISLNPNWDAFYLAPGSGRRLLHPTTATPDDYETACPTCENRFPHGTTDCEYCATSLIEQDSLSASALSAEEYAPFGVQVSVLRKGDIVAGGSMVDLGWTAPGTPADAPNTATETMAPGSEPMPADVSQRQDMHLRNEGNVIVLHALTGSGALYRTEVDPAVRSRDRNILTLPVIEDILFGLEGPWTLRRQQGLGAAGQHATTGLQVGDRDGVLLPVPMGQPVGNYSGDALLFVDLNGDGHLSFYSAKLNAVTTTQHHEFNPATDEPMEPVVPFTATTRVVESRVPQSDFYSMDMEPTLLIDPTRGNLQLIWAAQRPTPGSAGATAPAGRSEADVPSPIAATNIVWSDAELAAPLGDPAQRRWLWASTGDMPDEASALTVSATPDEQHSSPTAYIDPNNDSRWLLWHHAQTTPAGTSSQLLFDTSTGTDWSGGQPVAGTAGAGKGIAGFVRPGAADMHWLLWNIGPEGREQIRYHADFNPAVDRSPAFDLHVSNSIAGTHYDFFEIEYLDEFGEVGAMRYRKLAQNPFTFARQPSAFGGYDADGNFEMNVFFAGHIRALGSSDICWTRFNFGNPAEEGFPFTGLDTNFGKATFPNVANPLFADPAPPVDARGMPLILDAANQPRGYAGDRLEPSPRRQSFQARDIDWRLTYNYEEEPDWLTWLTATAGIEEYNDAKFYVSVTTGIGNDLTEQIYAVLWEEGSYDSATGIYTVVPQLVQIAPIFGELPTPDPGPPAWHPFHDTAEREDIFSHVVSDGVSARALLAPSARPDAVELGAWADTELAAQRWPAVTLQINPASGTLTWSTHLFNPDNPSDPMAVFNDENMPQIVEVGMYADYTPFVKRVTTDQANDDSPSAFFDVDDNRLTIFWRRSFGDTDAPHFGRPTFLHRTWTRSIELGHGPAAAISSVHDYTAGQSLTDLYSISPGDAGILAISPHRGLSPRRIGHRVQVEYTDADGITRTEQHRVTGWSVETPVPINNVVGEGPLRVVPEVYPITTATGTANAVRYWLVWSSPRSVFDLRPVEQGGQRMQQATDIYTAVVAPDYSTLIGDLQVPLAGY